MVPPTGALTFVESAVLGGLLEPLKVHRRQRRTREIRSMPKSCARGRFDVSSERHAAAHQGEFMVTIATFNEPAKARQLKRRFQDSGIKADVHNEGALQEFGFMSKPQANAKVMVEDHEFEKAQSLMIDWESTDPDISAALIRCPQCNSSNIEYPQMTRKFLTPALVGLLCALKIIPKEFYCQDCHFTWTNREEPSIGRLWHRFFPGGEAEQG